MHCVPCLQISRTTLAPCQTQPQHIHSKQQTAANNCQLRLLLSSRHSTDSTVSPLSVYLFSCHNQLMVPCITCEAEPAQAEECSVAWGTCSHSYHFHCITRWLRTRSTCPLDDEEWEFVQY